MKYSQTILFICVGGSALISAAPVMSIQTVGRLKSIANKAGKALEYTGSAATIGALVTSLVPNDNQARDLDAPFARAVIDEHEVRAQSESSGDYEYHRLKTTADNYAIAMRILPEACDFGNHAVNFGDSDEFHPNNRKKKYGFDAHKDELKTHTKVCKVVCASTGHFFDAMQLHSNKRYGSNVQERDLFDSLDALD